jgi:alpha-L-fucosidase
VDTIDQVIQSGPFEASWDSLTNYQVPAWYEDSKFGIFIHWGVFCVPAFGNEWYPRNMYIQGSQEFEHHVATYGPHTEFGYKDFIPQLTATNFDADAWAALFKQAGAGFVVPVAEHHDGFQMYDSALSEWNAARMGPKRDIVGELAAATRKHGMVFGLSSHRAEHWFFFDGGTRFESDVQDPRYAGLYGPAQLAPPDFHDPQSSTRPSQEFLDDWLARTCELVDKYQPQLVWFDWWIENAPFAPYLQRFAAYYYNRGAQWKRGVAINHKYEALPAGAAVFDIERGQVSDIYPRFWQNDTSVSKNSWGYISNHDYKTVDSIVDDLVDVVSKNGALLLNIGPRPDGTIPEPEQQMLREIGAWLALNGEAIYGTRPWKVFGEGPTEVSAGAFTDTKRAAFTGEDIRFTTKGDTLYAIALAWPGERLTIKSLGTAAGLLGGEVSSVELLGHAGLLIWERGEHGLMIALPEQLPCQHAFTFKIISR